MPAAPAPEKEQISRRTETSLLDDPKRCSSCNTRKPRGNFQGRLATCTSCLDRKRRLKKQGVSTNKLTEENKALKAIVETQAKSLSEHEKWKSEASAALRLVQRQLQYARLYQMQNCAAPQQFSTSVAGGITCFRHCEPETGSHTRGSEVSPHYLNHPFAPTPCIERMDETLVEIVPMQILPFEITANNDCVQPQPHTQACAAHADNVLAENDLKQLLDLPFDAFDDLQPHAAASDSTFFADGGSFITTTIVQQSDASVGVHNSTVFADGYQGVQPEYSSITTFGSGRGTGVQPEPSQIEISGNAPGHKEDSDEVWSIQTCDEAATATEETMFSLLSITFWQYGLVLVVALSAVIRRSMLEFGATVSNGVGLVLDNTDKIESIEGSDRSQPHEEHPSVVANVYLALWCSLCLLGSVGCWYLPTSARKKLALVSFQDSDARVLKAVCKKTVLPVIIMIPLVHMAFSMRTYLSTGNILEAVIDFIRRPAVLLTTGMVWLECPAESCVRMRRGLIYILAPTYVSIRLWLEYNSSVQPAALYNEDSFHLWWIFLGGAVLNTSLIEHLQESLFVLSTACAIQRYHNLWAFSVSVVALLFKNLFVSSSYASWWIRDQLVTDT